MIDLLTEQGSDSHLLEMMMVVVNSAVCALFTFYHFKL